MPQVAVHLLPQLVESQALAGQVAVVIDVLRATTTTVHALAAGADAVYYCAEIDEARQMASALVARRDTSPTPGAASLPDSPRVLLGGERRGLRIEGFDLGNSPDEYTPERVRGKAICFTTTNGTRAARHCHLASKILVGALVNRRAVAAELLKLWMPAQSQPSAESHEPAQPSEADQQSEVHLVCAGTQGEITGEDVLCAGAIVAELVRERASWQLNDSARLALTAWNALGCEHVATGLGSAPENSPPAPLLPALREALGGRNLMAEGFVADIATCARLDRFALAPWINTLNWSAQVG